MGGISRARVKETIEHLRAEVGDPGRVVPPAAPDPPERELADLLVRAQRAGLAVPSDTTALATRAVALRLAALRPGKTVEVRIPPFAAVQVGDDSGPSHTRGTPPSVVETDAATLLALAAGHLTWQSAIDSRALKLSGIHADLSDLFPLK